MPNAMFPRGPRFVPPKIHDVPGPNTYNINPESQLDAYKRGAFLEKADRFSKDKPVEAAPGPGRHDPGEMRSMSRTSVKASTTSSGDHWRKRVEELEHLLSESKRTHQIEVDRLHFDVARHHKTNVDLSERLEKQKKQTESLDVRIQELKKTTSADQAELKELRTKLRASEHERAQLSGKHGESGDLKKALQALESRRKEENREKDKKIAELERSLVETRKREAIEVQGRDGNGERRKGDKTQSTSSTVKRLELQVNEAQDKARQAHAALQALVSETAEREQEVVSQLEQYQSLIAKVADEYGRLTSTTVSASLHSDLKHRYSLLHVRLFRLERKLANAEGQVVELTNLARHTKDENALLSARLEELEEEVDFYSGALDDVTRDPDSRLDLTQEQAIQDALDAVAADIHECRAEDLELRALEDETVGRFYHLVNEELSKIYWSVDRCLDDSEELIQQNARNLEASSIAQTSFITQLEAAVAERLKIQTQLSASEASNEELEATSARLEQQLKEAETRRLEESAEHEKLLKKERHAVQVLTSTVQKSRTAEETLRSEVDQLTAELRDVERFQDAYYRLSDEVDALVARNELAETEAQRLSKFNAEILGHTNPAQRIMYVDRIRRELADTKHQLLKSTMEHETAVAGANALRQELDLFKSVAADNKPRSNITRVGRRVVLADQSINLSAILNDHSADEKIQHVQMLDVIPGDMTLDELSCYS